MMFKKLLFSLGCACSLLSCSTTPGAPTPPSLLAQTHRSNIATEATCTGTKSCSACKNCKYCKHCSKEGGTCGVCK